MKRLFILGIVIIFSFSLVACKKEKVNYIGSTEIIDDKAVFKEEIKPSNENAQVKENNIKEENSKKGNLKEENSKEVNTESSSRYDKLDNTKIGWGLGRNNQHKTPSIPDSWKSLLDKYNGLYIANENEKVVYLTFDEGYENGYTSKILDSLKSNNVKASFFVTGPYVQNNKELVKRMIDEGHIIGNHTINHPSLPSKSVTQVEQQIIELDRMIYDTWQVNIKFMRPPMGEISERVLAQLKDLGHTTVMWSFAYKDFDVDDQKGVDYAHDIIMENIHPGAILLLHAVSKDNANVLDRVIKSIKTEGYEIRNLDSISK